MFQLAHQYEELNRQGRRLALLLSVAVILLALTLSLLTTARGAASLSAAHPHAVATVSAHSRLHTAQPPLPCGAGWHYEFIGLRTVTGSVPAPCASRQPVEYV